VHNYVAKKRKTKNANSGKLAQFTDVVVSRYGFAWWVSFGW